MAPATAPGTVVVLDFGSQFAQLIARRVRELDVYCELLPHDTPFEEIERRGARAIILSGGPMSVYDAGAPRPDPAVWSGRLPVLGICYGAQLMAHELGGDVIPADRREYGPASVTITADDGLFTGYRPRAAGLDEPWRLDHPAPGGLPRHGPDRLEPVRGPRRTRAQPLRHPVPSRGGAHAARPRRLAQLRAGHRRDRADLDGGELHRHHRRRDRRARRPPRRARPARTGSSSAPSRAASIRRSPPRSSIARSGDRLTCIYVDHGLMRKKESELLRVTFERDLGMNLVMVDARERFLARLAGVEDPEKKRKIIGDEFIRVFEEEAAKLGRIDFLTQGTLYPDVIECATSETKAAQKIKTHHNVGGLPADLRFQLIEPLRYLFKDEVRKVGLELGLPEAMVLRQPFPGPGLAIRIIGEVTAERLDTLREADWIVIDEIKGAGLYRSLWQSFAILTPVRSVGVMGDGRTYANVVAIRAVTSEDGMTADWAKLPYDVLGKISVAHRQRGPRRQPRRLRHLLQTAGHDRVGMSRDRCALTPDRWAIPAPSPHASIRAMVDRDPFRRRRCRARVPVVLRATPVRRPKPARPVARRCRRDR